MLRCNVLYKPSAPKRRKKSSVLKNKKKVFNNINFVHSFVCLSSMVSREVSYAGWVRFNCLAYLQITENVFALLDFDREQIEIQLSTKYVIVELFENNICSCSCEEDNCLHIREISSLAPPYNDNVADGRDTFEYEYLTENLIGIYAEADNTYSILKQTPRMVKCLKCIERVTSCVHRKAFDKYKPTQANIRTQQTFQSVSTELIPYPFDDENDINAFSEYAIGKREYPTNLIPTYDAAKICEHGNFFSNQEQKLRDAQIHVAHVSKPCQVYYRPALGNCKCKQYYDGRSDLLLNLDNNHLYAYGWMLDILHNTQETRFPLHSAYRSARRTREMCKQYIITRHDYDNMRKAYNAFIRLLNLNYEQMYDCTLCAPDYDKVIMDGLMMGKKNLLFILSILY